MLLNFRLTTLDERMAEGADWSRRDWAEARLAQGEDRGALADLSSYIALEDTAAQPYLQRAEIHYRHLDFAQAAPWIEKAADLFGFGPTPWLPDRPLDRLLIRHTVGLGDPLTAAVLSLAEIKEMVNEMLQQNRDYLPQFEHLEA